MENSQLLKHSATFILSFKFETIMYLGDWEQCGTVVSFTLYHITVPFLIVTQNTLIYPSTDSIPAECYILSKAVNSVEISPCSLVMFTEAAH